MTRLLVDTSAYSALLRGRPEVASALRQADEIHVNPVILGELLAGFIRGKNRKKNEDELKVFLSSPRVSVATIDHQTAERYALILDSLWKQGTLIPTNDLWIAATAAQHGLRILTLDAHFNHVSHVQVECIDLTIC